MPIDTVVQKFYSYSKTALKKAIASSAREDEDLAEGDQVSFSSAKESVASSSTSGSQATDSVSSFVPKLLPPVSEQTPGFLIKLSRWQDQDSISQKLGLMDKYFCHAPGLYSGTPFTHEEMVRLKPKAHTTGAIDCTAGVVMNTGAGQDLTRKLGRLLSPAKGTLFHLNPKEWIDEVNFKPLTEKDKEVIAAKLSQDIATLQEKGEVMGLITGGQVIGGKLTSTLSRQLQNLLVSIFQKAGIQHITQIWGRRGGETHLIMDAPNRTIYWFATDGTTKSKPLRTLADLAKHYAHIHFSPWDHIETAEGLFTGQQLNDALEKRADCLVPLT